MNNRPVLLSATFAQALDAARAIHAPNRNDRAGSERQWRAAVSNPTR